MDEPQGKKEFTVALLRLPPHLHAETKEIARKRGVSLNKLFTDILSEYLHKVPVPLKAVEKDGEFIYEINVPPDYFVEGEND